MATIENIDQLENLLKDLDREIKKEVMKRGAPIAAKPLIEELKSTSPGGISGGIARSFGSKFNNEEQAVEIGPRKGKKYQGFLVWFFEKGTKPRKTKTATKIYKRKVPAHNTGQILPTGFWSEAIEKKQQDVIDGLYQAFEVSYNKIIKKYERFYK